MATKKQIDLANWEIFLWSLHNVGGDAGMIDVELAFLKAHEFAPQRFAWRTREDLPEYKKLSKALRDADAKAGRLMTRTSDGLKRQLTVEGIDWVNANMQKLKQLGASSFKAGQARSVQSTKWFDAIQHSSEFNSWRTNKEVRVEKWRLAELLQCTPDSPAETWESRIEQTKVAAHSAGRDDVVNYLSQLGLGLTKQ